MTKLSEQLRLLADRAAAIEDRAEAAREEAVEKRDEKVAEAQARLKEQEEAFSTQVTAMSEDAQAAWSGVKDSLKSTGDKMRSKVEKGVHTLEAKDAEASADWAEAYVYDAVEFSLLAVAEADAAVMESIAARARANELAAVEKTNLIRRFRVREHRCAGQGSRGTGGGRGSQKTRIDE